MWCTSQAIYQEMAKTDILPSYAAKQIQPITHKLTGKKKKVHNSIYNMVHSFYENIYWYEHVCKYILYLRKSTKEIGNSASIQVENWAACQQGKEGVFYKPSLFHTKCVRYLYKKSIEIIKPGRTFRFPQNIRQMYLGRVEGWKLKPSLNSGLDTS